MTRFTPRLTELEPLQAPNTWVAVHFDPADPFSGSEWYRSVVHYAVNAIAGRFTNPSLPVVHVTLTNGPTIPGALAEATWTAPGFGLIRANVPRIVTERYDLHHVIVHEFGHAGFMANHTGGPSDAMRPYAYPTAAPWSGTFTATDRAEFAAHGFYPDAVEPLVAPPVLHGIFMDVSAGPHR